MDYGYVVYLDVLVLQMFANFVFDYLLLWATAEVVKARTNIPRLIAGASVGALYFLILRMAYLQLIPHYGILRTFPVVLGITIPMLAATFAPVPWKRLFFIWRYFLLIGFIAAGAGIGSAYVFEGTQGRNDFMGIVVSIATILVVAELGWGVVQKRMWQRIYQMPIEVKFGDSRLKVNALVDTGNHLRDPITGNPVVIMEYRTMCRLLPERLRPIIASMEKGDLSHTAQLLASSQWSSRFRVIPFASIGKENGLLVGFRPDHLTVHHDGEPVDVPNVIIGVHNQQLDPNGEYQALIHPEVLELAAGIIQDRERHSKRGKSTDASKIQA